VQSARNSQIILNEEISVPEVHLPSFGAYSLVWMQNIAHWKLSFVIPIFCFPNFIKAHIFSQGLARASKWTNYPFYYNQEINALWSKDYRVTHRVYFMNVYYSLFSEIVTISPVNGSFQEHEKFGKPWSTLKGHAFLQRFSGVQKSPHFLMELNTHSQHDSSLFLKVTSDMKTSGTE
jgi:hypothetical protein